MDAGIVTEGFRQAVGTLLTAMVEEPGLLVSGTRRIHPLLLLAIPLGALILTTRWQLYRTEGAPPLARLGWAALVAVPFALLMLVFAVIGGDSDTTRISPSPGSAFALGLLWGVLGGLIGAATKLPLAEATRAPARAADRARRGAGDAAPAGGGAGDLHGDRARRVADPGRADAGGVRAGRSAPTALIEEAAFAGEHGIHLTALAAGARFTADANGALGLPFPVEDANDVPGRDGGFRIFSYDDALPAYVLLPALVLLMGLVALGALYAGFAAARAAGAHAHCRPAPRGARSPARHGRSRWRSWSCWPAGCSTATPTTPRCSAIFLLGGAVLGAAGGALAVSGQAPVASSSSS